MNSAKTMLLVTGILELILGIPILGGLIVIGFAYVPLFVMFVLHVIALVLAAGEHRPRAGSILGIVTSLLAWIPILGMILHLCTALVLLITAGRGGSAGYRRP